MNAKRSSKVALLVWGPRACFRRPELTTDLVTYDVMPPTVARQLVRTALGSGDWLVESITVCNPIRFRWEKLKTARGERRAMILMDVAYIIAIRRSREILTDNEIVMPYVHLGLVDFSAKVRLIPEDKILPSSLAGSGLIDLGWMILDTTGSRSRFFRASMNDGVIDLTERSIDPIVS